MVTTDYTSEKLSTLHGAHITRYRAVHWMIDILKNFFSDVINIKDERIANLLNIDRDGSEQPVYDTLVRVEAPYTTDSRKACSTPAVLVSAGATKYPVVPVTAGVGAHMGVINAIPNYKRTVGRSVDLTVAVLTESCDGTCLLADLIEDFLIVNSLNFQKEGMIQQLTVRGGSDLKIIAAGEGVNAKDLDQLTLSINTEGSLTWTNDTQGPVFRGLKIQPTTTRN